VSVVSEQELNTIFPSASLNEYEGSPLLGYSSCMVQVKEQYMMKVDRNFTLIAGHQRPALLGRNWLSSLRLDWTPLNKILHSPIERLLAHYSQISSQELVQ